MNNKTRYLFQRYLVKKLDVELQNLNIKNSKERGSIGKKYIVFILKVRKRRNHLHATLFSIGK